jgi:hypothetical protein
VIREDAGYPNSERDEEPMKAAVSDALKRCAVLFGIGRHLYDDNKVPVARRPVRNGPEREEPPAAAAKPVKPTPKPPTRPHLVDTDLLEPEDDDIDELRAVPAARTDLKVCPIHDVPWAGQPGDLFHKDQFGKWCRHPDNVQKVRAR